MILDIPAERKTKLGAQGSERVSASGAGEKAGDDRRGGSGVLLSTAFLPVYNNNNNNNIETGRVYLYVLAFPFYIEH